MGEICLYVSMKSHLRVRVLFFYTLMSLTSLFNCFERNQKLKLIVKKKISVKIFAVIDKDIGLWIVQVAIIKKVLNTNKF